MGGGEEHRKRGKGWKSQVRDKEEGEIEDGIGIFLSFVSSCHAHGSFLRLQKTQKLSDAILTEVKSSHPFAKKFPPLLSECRASLNTFSASVKQTEVCCCVLS